MKALSSFLLLFATMLLACPSSNSKKTIKTDGISHSDHICDSLQSGDQMQTYTIGKYMTSNEKGQLVYCPDCNSKSACYVHYLYDEKEIQDLVGKNFSELSFTVMVEIIDKTLGDVHRDDKEASPEGGFKMVYYTCKIKEVIKTEKFEE